MSYKLQPEIHTFPDGSSLAQAVAREWVEATAGSRNSARPFNVALAGGSTPQKMFRELSRPKISRQISWKNIHVFWGDERCVPPDHPESNYRSAWVSGLKYWPLTQDQVHRIRGENDPSQEADRYAREIRDGVEEGGAPLFDWIFLGMGADGHTASLFPGVPLQTEPLNICGVATHPESGQKRISLTLETLNRARRVSFLVTGRDKAERVSEILCSPAGDSKWPAGQVRAGRVEWFLDQAAAALLQD